MVVSIDKLGRTWKGRKIYWIKSMNCCRRADYSWVIKDGERHLIYDKKKGMYDNTGINVKDSKIELIPVLEGKDGKEWVHFPSSPEAIVYKNSLTYSGYVEKNNDNLISNFNNIEDFYKNNDYDDEYDIYYNISHEIE